MAAKDFEAWWSKYNSGGNHSVTQYHLAMDAWYAATKRVEENFNSTQQGQHEMPRSPLSRGPGYGSEWD